MKTKKSKTIQLAEKIVVKPNNQMFGTLDRICYESKNLYNSALFEYRKVYFHNRTVSKTGEGSYRLLPTYLEQDKSLKTHDKYKANPAKVSQQTLKLVEQNWNSYLAALKAYYEDPSKFKSKPKPPDFLGDKKVNREDGRFVAVYTIQALNKRSRLKNLIKLSGTDFEIKSNILSKINAEPEKYKLNQVRVVPKLNYYVIEVVYTREKIKNKLLKQRLAAIDLGVNNLATVVFNGRRRPLIINGRPLKSINHFYNKEIAKLQSKLGTETSKRIRNHWRRRHHKIMDYIHKATKTLLTELLKMKVATVVVGYNQGWKQNINLGDRNNQNFVQIPFLTFVNTLKYKCEMNGIKLITREESYTSQASALDHDFIPTREEGVKNEVKFSGYRKGRGLYISSNKTRLNADVNGALNIMRKHLLESGMSKKAIRDFIERTKVCVVTPRKLVVKRPTLTARITKDLTVC